MSAEPEITTGSPSGSVPVEGALVRAATNGANGTAHGPNGGPNGVSHDQPSSNGFVPANGHGTQGSQSSDQPTGCTAAQLRRFIKSRAYVPMHELRRRFELNGEADDVSPVDTQSGLVYLGLPWRESQLIGDLVRQGEVGLELCRDPRVPIVVGVFPMRPITRQ
jgi:hypothetical protein